MQQFVRDAILALFPDLSERDVRSTSMGASGVDIQLSEKAFALYPYEVECKNNKRHAVYKFYEQRVPTKGAETLVVLKQDHAEPLALISFKHFMELIKRCK